MKFSEKKYRVDSFDSVVAILSQMSAKQVKHVVSTHFYGSGEGNDVEKFVEYEDRIEIHILKQQRETFVLTESRRIANKDEGFAWLRKKGYSSVDIVTMDYSEYSYAHGTVGLYIIDGFLRSVILYCPTSKHKMMEEAFGLSTAEVITKPYNKYLKVLGKLRSEQLDMV